MKKAHKLLSIITASAMAFSCVGAAAAVQTEQVVSSALEQICENYTELQKNRENERIYRYLLDKAKTDIIANELSQLREKVGLFEEKLESIRQSLELEAENSGRLQAEYNDLQLQLATDETQRRIGEIDKEIALLRHGIDSAEKDFNKTTALISAVRNMCTKANNILAQKSSLADMQAVDGVVASLLESLVKAGEKLTGLFAELDDITPQLIIEYSKERFENIIKLIDSVKSNANVLYSRLEEELRHIGERLGELKAERENLEKGIYKFPQNALDLKQAVIAAIKADSGENANVVIVAEAAEIKSPRWRNSIEGYLNKQKFYVIVPPQYMKTAIRVFDRIKRDKSVYDTGIVDVDRIRRKNYTADTNSLAAEIETSNPFVRIYLDYILGRVIKCDNPDNIRSFPTSVTDDGLLYKNYVVRALNPKLWQNPAIGQNAIRLRLEEIENEIAGERKSSGIYSSLKLGVDACRVLDNYSKSDIERFATAAENMIKSEDYKERIARLTDEKSALDTGNLIILGQRLQDKKQQLDESEKKRAVLQGEGGRVEEQLRSLNEEKIPQTINFLNEKQAELERSFDLGWIEEVGELRYIQELSKRGAAENINTAFPRELSKAQNAIEKFEKLLSELRSQYNYNFKMGYDVNSYDNSQFDNALREINENELPNYLSRIDDTKRKAMEEFQEDFLSKLNDNIRSVKREISELNRAISSASFGEDTYSFRVEPNKQYERYYKMITDDMLLVGGYNLMSNQFNTKYKSEIEDLFSIITDEGNTSLDQSDYENRIRTFTDYRTYLNFDIEVTNQAGEVQRLSKTIGKKSGGETQTPFYIAVLASFAQLYRIGRDSRANTSRLIIFDEAFSKMDGERIEKSIGLLRKLDFQVILATPTEKAGDIAPLVDRVLLVLRRGTSSRITYFDKERIGELNDEG